MSKGIKAWLSDGWVRDNFNETLHRQEGELHRGPDGGASSSEGGGWSDRNLALMLRDHLKGDDVRATALRDCNTRIHLLELASEWGVPYITQRDWERKVDSDEAWFTVEPIPRSKGPFTPWLSSKVLVLANLADVQGSINHDDALSRQDYPALVRARDSAGVSVHQIGGGGGLLEGLWDWDAGHDDDQGGWLNATSGISVRPLLAPPGVRMLYSQQGTLLMDSNHPPPPSGDSALVAAAAVEQRRNDGDGNDIAQPSAPGSFTAMLEFEPSRKLMEVKDVMLAVESVWGLRRHRIQLSAMSGQTGQWKKLKPSHRLVDLPSSAVQVGGSAQQNHFPMKLSVVQWPAAADVGGGHSGSSGGEEVGEEGRLELSILSFAFDSNAECDKHAVRAPLLWRMPIEGATHQVAVAVEMDSAYGIVDGAPDEGVERLYALVDTRSGKVLSSFTHPKPGFAARMAALFTPVGVGGTPGELPLTFTEAYFHLIYIR